MEDGAHCRARPRSLDRIVKAVAAFNNFCAANDRAILARSTPMVRLFFKIEYYDKTLTYHSPDPSNPSVTERVITIMLADEY